jgi:hypothetical protein
LVFRSLASQELKLSFAAAQNASILPEYFC